MQSQTVANPQDDLPAGFGSDRGLGRGRGQLGLAAQLFALGGQGAFGLGQHHLHRRADHRLHRRGHRPFHQRRFAQEHISALLVGQEIQRRLRAQQGAAQIHQDDHAIVAVDRVNGLHDLHRVRADGVVSIVDAPRDGQGYAPLCHLLGQLANALGQPGAVGYDD